MEDSIERLNELAEHARPTGQVTERTGTALLTAFKTLMLAHR